MQISDGGLGGVTKFENVPDDEDRQIKDMEAILQEKMSKDYPEGQIKRDAHSKSLACLKAEFIVIPDIPAELKVGIFEFPQTYPKKEIQKLKEKILELGKTHVGGSQSN